MSSPFAFFRKNQRVWMAVLVIVSIVAFVILPNMDSYLKPDDGQARRNTQTLVSWKGGKIDADRMNRLQTVHGQTYRIFSQMATEVLQAGGTPNVPGFSMGQQGIEIGIERPENIQSVLQVRLFAEAARKHGIVVDDKTVDQFIKNFSDKKITPKRFSEIIREVGGDSLSKFDMYDFLRDEIAKQILVQLGYAGLANSQQSLVPPSKNWMNFQKFQQRAKVEAYPVFVDQYLEKVTAKPSEQELRTLYAKAKEFLPHPSNPEPGFRRPYQANIEFLIADLGIFLKDEEAKLTDEMLKESYEKRVANEGAFKVPVEEFKPTEPPTTDKPDGDKPDGDKPDGDKPVGDKPDGDKPVGEAATSEKPASESADASPSTEDKKPMDDKSSEKSAKEPENQPKAESEDKPGDKPASEDKPSKKKAQNKKKEAPKSDDEKSVEPAQEPKLPESSSNQLSARSSLRLVAFQADPATEAKTDGEAKAEAKSAAPSDADAAKNAETPKSTDAPNTDETPKVDATPKADEPKKADDVPKAEVTNLDVGNVKVGDAAPAEKPMRTKTFDEVREEVRRDLALKPAQEKMQASIAAAQEMMDQYYNHLSLFKTADPNNPDTLEPTLPSLAKLADQFGLTYGTTGMVDALSVETLPIGRSFTQFGAGQFDMFPRSVFNNRLRVFQPASSQGFGNGSSQTFLFWKTQDANSRIPSYDEVQEEVVKAWKIAEARKLATQAAQDLASSINVDGGADPWLNVLDPSLQPLVLKPPMFTWLQPMLTQNDGIQLAMIEGIDQAGQAFMEKSFSTPIGKAAAAMDASQQKCFVIRVIERNPSDEQLRADFEKAPMSRGVVSLAMQQTEISARRWFDSLIEEMNLDTSNLIDSESNSQE